MMDLTLFRDRTYSLAIVTIFAVLFAIYGMLLVTTQYLQNVRGFSPTEAGLLLLPYSVTATLVSLRAGRLVGKVGSRRLILAGLAFLIGGLARHDRRHGNAASSSSSSASPWRPSAAPCA